MINIGNISNATFKVGSDDISIYLGDEKVYPLGEPLKYSATLSNGDTFTINCNNNPTLTSGETWYNSTRQTTTTAATVGKCVTTLGENVFRYFQNLISVDIPSTVTSFSSSSFEGCHKLKTINIPSGITSIPTRCFIQCYELNNVIIHDSVTRIGDYAFQQCTSLTSIDIPSGATNIGNSAFYNCTSLTSIEIPNSVTSIGNNAFKSCSGLTNITCMAETPPTLLGDKPQQFDDTSDCPILVMSQSLEAYKNAWSQYASRIQAIP